MQQMAQLELMLWATEWVDASKPCSRCFHLLQH